MSHFEDLYSKPNKQRSAAKQSFGVSDYNKELDIIKKTIEAIITKIQASCPNSCDRVYIENEPCEAWKILNFQDGIIYLTSSKHLVLNHDILDIKHINSLSELSSRLSFEELVYLRKTIELTAHMEFNIREKNNYNNSQHTKPIRRKSLFAIVFGK